MPVSLIRMSLSFLLNSLVRTLLYFFNPVRYLNEAFRIVAPRKTLNMLRLQRTVL
jgi:hypothetical protein